MPILRKEHTNNYTVISNTALRDNRLSYKALGLLCFMLSCSDEWKFTVKNLAEARGISEPTVSKILDELETCGYHEKQAIRENGKIKEWVYVIREEPADQNEDFLIKNSFIKKDLMKKTLPYNNTNIEINTKENNTNKKPKENKFSKCSAITRELLVDEEVITELDKYLRFRLTKGLSPDIWRELIIDLQSMAKTKEDALEIIKNATLGSYRKFYPLKKSYSNTYKDNIPDKPKDFDEEDLHREEFRKTFQHLTMSERPNYKEWKKEKGYA